MRSFVWYSSQEFRGDIQNERAAARQGKTSPEGTGHDNIWMGGWSILFGLQVGLISQAAPAVNREENTAQQ